MTVAIYWALVLAPFLQIDRRRFAAAAIFSVATVAFVPLGRALDGFAYYGAAALFDLAVVAALGLVRQPCRLAVTLQRLSALSILLNLTGFVLWLNYFGPKFYNGAYVGYYVVVLLFMLWRDPKNAAIGASAPASGRRVGFRGLVFRGLAENEKNRGPV